jgi:ferredoxin-type protein NapH
VATPNALKPKFKKKSKYFGRFWPTTRAVTTILFFVFIGSTLWAGSSCYLDLGAFGIACPLGAAQVMVATGTFISALAIGSLISFLLIVAFGRAFCSWICPGRWIFNRGPKTRTKSWKYKAWVQRAIIGGVVGAAWLCHTPVFCVICPVGVACRGAIAAGTGGSLAPTVAWMGVLVGAEWASGLSWCRDLCPLGALFTRFSRLNPFIKVKKNPEICKPCNICERSCAEGINLSVDVDFSACTKCFECEDVCPRGAVEIKLSQIEIRRKG